MWHTTIEARAWNSEKAENLTLRFYSDNGWSWRFKETAGGVFSQISGTNEHVHYVHWWDLHQQWSTHPRMHPKDAKEHFEHALANTCLLAHTVSFSQSCRVARGEGSGWPGALAAWQGLLQAATSQWICRAACLFPPWFSHSPELLYLNIQEKNTGQLHYTGQKFLFSQAIFMTFLTSLSALSFLLK